MSNMLLRNIDPHLKRRLEAEARRQNRSLSDVAKLLIQRGLTANEGNVGETGLGTMLHALVRAELWTEDFLPERDRNEREQPDFR